MKQYSKKAIGLILLIVITSLVLAFLVAGQFYISAFIAGMILLIEAWYLLRQMERSDRLFRHFVWSLIRLPFLGCNTPGTVGCPPARTDRSGGRGFAIL